MRLSNDQTDEVSFGRLGAHAARLLRDANYAELAARFGYALAYGHDPAQVIETEVASCLSQAAGGGKLLASATPSIVVKYFQPNDTSLYALIECMLPLENHAGSIFAELIVTSIGAHKHVFLEQVSYAA